jgi:hypothetical protein
MLVFGSIGAAGCVSSGTSFRRPFFNKKELKFKTHFISSSIS